MSTEHTRKLEWLLKQLCVDLGFCLPPSSYWQLFSQLPMSVDDFVAAIFAAEGRDAEGNKTLRKQVHALVTKRYPEVVTAEENDSANTSSVVT